jgi:hypothetical protein
MSFQNDWSHLQVYTALKIQNTAMWKRLIVQILSTFELYALTEHTLHIINPLEPSGSYTHRLI